MLEKIPYKKPKPTISLDETELPAIKNWEVGKTYNVKASVKMVFQAEGNEWGEMVGQEQKPKVTARLKILSITPEKESKPKKTKMIPRVKQK